MDIQEQIQYWIDTAEHDLKTAEHLFEKGDYAWCLFIGHLVLEKLLKALYVRDKQQIPPRTHKSGNVSQSNDACCHARARTIFVSRE